VSEPLRFTTLRIGVISLHMGEQDFELETRVLQGSDGLFRVLFGGLSEPFASLEEAVRWAEAPKPQPPDVSFQIRWRADDMPLEPHEHACPTCGAPASGAPRYPRCSCPACMFEVTDAQGRALSLWNVDATGGFEARYADGTRYEGHECWIRGVRCWADEHYFGGVVVQPIP
jgi:hypothetical protein